jgi:hypothetical protein
VGSGGGGGGGAAAQQPSPQGGGKANGETERSSGRQRAALRRKGSQLRVSERRPTLASDTMDAHLDSMEAEASVDAVNKVQPLEGAGEEKQVSTVAPSGAQQQPPSPPPQPRPASSLAVTSLQAKLNRRKQQQQMQNQSQDVQGAALSGPQDWAQPEPEPEPELQLATGGVVDVAAATASTPRTQSLLNGQKGVRWAGQQQQQQQQRKGSSAAPPGSGAGGGAGANALWLQEKEVALRRDLDALKPSLLRKRAGGSGIIEAEIDAAEETA